MTSSIETTIQRENESISPTGLASSLETYQKPANEEEDSEDAAVLRSPTNNSQNARTILFQFVLMAVLFSCNHGCVVACLSLASARLGSSLGNWQSGVLYLTYTGTALVGATYTVKRLGPRNALVTGMAFYCFYVAAFWIGSISQSTRTTNTAALLGASLGGIGAGLLWTAQGAFFARAAERHAQALGQETSVSTTKLAGIFAFWYLALELILRSLSSVLTTSSVGWSTVFATYSLVTIGTTVAMALVPEPPPVREPEETIVSVSAWSKVLAAWNLLRHDPKMPYMIGLNAVFGFAAAFLNSYVNGQVVQVALDDPDSRYVGWLTAWTSAVAAAMSLVFSRTWGQQQEHKGVVLSIGAVCFFLVAFPFVLLQSPNQIPWWGLVLVYSLHGTGRATFEGTLKATFADFFAYEKEGAFANIILQNGLASAMGFVISTWTCPPTQRQQCVEYSDGTFHNISISIWMVLLTAVLAVGGYWRAWRLHQNQPPRSPSIWTLAENDGLV